ncbi:arsenic resistance N-acetyltransferase ArsN2 [Roseiarcus sp.]|uniref:arsenic resistance N-acetyltransferase ArsN2 n=1 Tax=Roseiarcus sp. TaxID=1969460 RepID=UPI003F9CF3F7
MTDVLPVEPLNGAKAVDGLRPAALALEDLVGLRNALRAAGLPEDDLDADGVSLFAFEQGGSVVGYGGLEIYGGHALLRSIVVDPARRREGLGRRIVEFLNANAARESVRRAFLLTTDARAYFEGLGFAAIDRRDAPPEILATRQATGLCPASAVLMAKALRG